jgi:hypothetical protein
LKSRLEESSKLRPSTEKLEEMRTEVELAYGLTGCYLGKGGSTGFCSLVCVAMAN